jgi:hypothetical protein
MSDIGVWLKWLILWPFKASHSSPPEPGCSAAPRTWRAGRRTPANDFRQYIGWWKPDNYDTNVAIVTELTKFAETKGATLAQLTIAWLRKRTTSSPSPDQATLTASPRTSPPST